LFWVSRNFTSTILASILELARKSI
jgi:hypothetical protein